MLATKLMRAIETLALVERINSHLRMIPIPKMHYMCIVAVNDMLNEKFIAIGMALSLVDLRTVWKLGFPVQLATNNRNFGSF